MKGASLWFGSEFLMNIPVDVTSASSREVGGRLVDHGDFQSLGFGLLLASDVDENSVLFAVLVRIKFGFDP
jgi:hypothetical protein